MRSVLPSALVARPLAVSEAEWQRQVLDMVKLYRWRAMHVRKAKGRRDGKEAWQTPTSIAGWSDLFIWKPDGSRTPIFLELKSEKEKPTPAQEQFLAEMAANGFTALWARPSQFEEIRALLAR